MTVKILHCAETVKGGVGTVIDKLMDAQINDRNVSSVFCLVPDLHRYQLSSIDDRFVYTFSRTGRNLKSFLSFMANLLSLLRKYRPDVIHIHSTFSGVMARIILLFLKPFYRPVIIYCPHAFSFLMTSTKIKSKVYSIVEKILSLATDCIICVSHYEYNKAQEFGISKDKMIVIHNGVEPKLGFYKNNKGDEVFKLLFVGRLDYQKGFDLLIEAFSMIKNKNIQLHVVGDVVNDEITLPRLENVFYYGWVKPQEIEKYFIMSDFLVIPSRWEGFAIVPLEAMSYGLPVIASNSTSLPEIVVDGHNGFLFQNGDVDSLVAIINKAYNSSVLTLGQNGQRLITESFSSSSMTSKTIALYKKFL